MSGQKLPLEDVDIPIDLMKRVGLLADPNVKPYVDWDDDLDVDEAIELLAGAGLLTEQQAAVYVRRRIEEIPREQAAEAIGISVSTLDDYLRHAEQKIAMASVTMDVLEILGAELE